MVAHYGDVNGNGQAGAVTYFGFLSFFPILALGFFVVGQLAMVYPAIEEQMAAEIDKLLPGVVGTDSTQIQLDTVTSFSGLAGLLGLVGPAVRRPRLALRAAAALEVMFATPRGEQPGFLFGKLRDLGTLALIGLTLMVSVVLSGAVTGFSGPILGLVGIDRASTLPTALLGVVGHALAIGALDGAAADDVRLLLVDTHVPRGALVRGALLGAVGFEVLKAGEPAARADPGKPGVPGLRGRADPAGLDQLLLPPGDVRRRVGLHLAGRARAAHHRGDAGPGGGAHRRRPGVGVPGPGRRVAPPRSAADRPAPPTTPSPWLVVAGRSRAGPSRSSVEGARR